MIRESREVKVGANRVNIEVALPSLLMLHFDGEFRIVTYHSPEEPEEVLSRTHPTLPLFAPKAIIYPLNDASRRLILAEWSFKPPTSLLPSSLFGKQ